MGVRGLLGSGHHSFTWTDGSTVTLPNTPSDHRSVANCRQQMRKTMGWKHPGHGKQPKPKRLPPIPVDASRRQKRQLAAVIRKVGEPFIAEALLNGQPQTASAFKRFIDAFDAALKS